MAINSRRVLLARLCAALLAAPVGAWAAGPPKTTDKILIDPFGYRPADPELARFLLGAS